MVQYTQVECHDCFGIFPGNVMRRKSTTKATGRHTRDYDPFDQNDLRQALSSSTTSYSTSEILLCSSCRSKRGVLGFLKFLLLLALIGASAYFGVRHFSKANATPAVAVSNDQLTASKSESRASTALSIQSSEAEFDFYAPAQKINEGNCRMGECGWTTTLSLETEEDRNGSELKKMRFVYGSTPQHFDEKNGAYGHTASDKKQITWSDDISEVYVFCSKRLPSVMLVEDDSVQTTVLDFSQISGGILSGAAALFVEACHGLNHAAYMGDGFMERYGYKAGGSYSAVTGNQVIELSRPDEIFAYDQ